MIIRLLNIMIEVMIIIRIRIRIIRDKIIKIIYISIFNIPRVNIDIVDFLIETPFYINYISTYYIYFFIYII